MASAAIGATSAQSTIDQTKGSLMTVDSAQKGHVELAHALQNRELADDMTESQSSTSQEEVVDCIGISQVVSEPTVVVQAVAAETLTETKLRYSDPRVIYQRYVEAREAWYNT